jgi:CheY-like chemotaxis protein
MTATAQPALPAIVCDDDAIARGIVANLARDAGFDVIAETDNAGEALMLIERFGVREVVIDLSLAVGRGEDVLRLIKHEGLPCKAVVFGAYIPNPDWLLQEGATAVVEKPDFDRLTDLLRAHSAELRDDDGSAPAVDRRRPVQQARPRVEPRFRSPSGFAPPSELDAMVDGLEPGDIVLAIDVEGLGSIERAWGAMTAADHRLEIVRALRWAIRSDDEVAMTADGEIVVLLIHPTPETAGVVYRRITDAWARAGTTGEIKAASATCRDDEPHRGTLGRALGGLRNAINPGVTYT